MSGICEVCGEAASGETLRGGCIWCTSRKGFVCRHCSAMCDKRTQNMLPNGTRCIEAWRREPEEDKLLKRPFLPASPEQVAKERERYGELSDEFLIKRLREAAKWYDGNRENDSCKPQLPTARARLTALQQLIKERRAAG